MRNESKFYQDKENKEISKFHGYVRIYPYMPGDICKIVRWL